MGASGAPLSPPESDRHPSQASTHCHTVRPPRHGTRVLSSLTDKAPPSSPGVLYPHFRGRGGTTGNGSHCPWAVPEVSAAWSHGPARAGCTLKCPIHTSAGHPYTLATDFLTLHILPHNPTCLFTPWLPHSAGPLPRPPAHSWPQHPSQFTHTLALNYSLHFFFGGFWPQWAAQPMAVGCTRLPDFFQSPLVAHRSSSPLSPSAAPGLTFPRTDLPCLCFFP